MFCYLEISLKLVTENEQADKVYTNNNEINKKISCGIIGLTEAKT